MANTCFPSVDETVVVKTEVGFLEGIYNGYDKISHLHIVDVPGPRKGEREIVEVSIIDLYVNPKAHQDV